MFTVAIIGPDGVGKTTVSRRLETALPFCAKYVYMGVNLEASNLLLPTTRLILEIKRRLGRRPDMAGPPDPARLHPRPRGPVRRVLAAVKSAARMTNQLMEETFRQGVIRWHLIRGRVVLLDRDFFADYYAHDVVSGKGRPLARRIHGFVLRRFYRRPDVVICLDADAETMFARKCEGTVELLQRRRGEYHGLRECVKRFELVDATRPIEAVLHDVHRRICRYYDEQIAGKALGGARVS